MTYFALKNFKDVKHLLAPESWVAQRFSGNSEGDDEWVLFAENEVETDFIDLDRPQHLVDGLAADTAIWLILVRGSLTVGKFIFNEETDGACGLHVLGDLSVPTMLVGGQEVYVAGNVHIGELFWGDYNHGDLNVAGDVDARVFVETEGYHTHISGRQNFARHLSNYDELGDWQYIDSAQVKAIFDAVLFDEDVPEEDYEGEDDLAAVLSRGDRVLAHLQAGKSLLHPGYVANGYVYAPQKPATREDLRALATVAEIRRILALPVIVERYDDYYNDDRNAFWRGRYCFSFRKKTADDDERVGVAREIASATEGFDCDFYQFDIEETDGGSEQVVVKFQPHNGRDFTPQPIALDDAAAVQEAHRRFVALRKAVELQNKAHLEAEAQRVEMQRIRQEKRAGQAPCDKAQVEFCGVSFKVIRQIDAEPYIGALDWGTADTHYEISPFPNEADGYYLLAEEDVVCEKFDMDWDNHPEGVEVAGLIFAKNLTITTCLLSAEIDVSPYFVVLGNLSAPNIGLWGNTHYVGGDLKCMCLYGKYNHGSLYVHGDTTAVGAIITDDFTMCLADIHTQAIVDSCGRIETIDGYEAEDGVPVRFVTPCDATHDMREVLADSVLAHDEAENGYGGYYVTVMEHMQNKRNVLDMDKIAATIAGFRRDAHKEFERVSRHSYFRKENSWVHFPIEDITQIIDSILRLDDGTLVVSHRDDRRHILHQVVLVPEKGLKRLFGKGEITLHTYYYHEDNQSEKMHISSSLDETNLEVWQAMYAFRKVVQGFDETH